jgi:hypothetical protein
MSLQAVFLESEMHTAAKAAVLAIENVGVSGAIFI